MIMRSTGPNGGRRLAPTATRDLHKPETGTVHPASQAASLGDETMLKAATELADRIKASASHVSACVGSLSDTVTWDRKAGSVGAIVAMVLDQLPPGPDRHRSLAEIGEQFANNIAREGPSAGRARQIFNEILNCLPLGQTSTDAVEGLVGARLDDLVRREFAQRTGGEIAAEIVGTYGAANAKKLLEGASYIVPGDNHTARLVLSFTQSAVAMSRRDTP